MSGDSSRSVKAALGRLGRFILSYGAGLGNFCHVIKYNLFNYLIIIIFNFYSKEGKT